MASPVIATSATFADAANATSRTIAKPTGTASGDWLVLFVSIDGTATITQPTGFTTIFDQQEMGTTMRFAIYTRKADGSEGSTFTVATSNEIANGGILRITGGDSTEIIEALSIWGNTLNAVTSPAIIPAPDAYAETDDTLILRVAAFDDGADSFSATPSGHTLVFNVGANSSGTKMACYEKNQAAAGYVGTSSWTYSDNTEDGWSVTLVLRSTATPATPPAQPYIKCMNILHMQSGRTTTIEKPYGTADNELLVLVSSSDTGSGALTPPGTFTSIQDTNNSAAIYHQAYYRVASGEGSSYSVATSSAGGALCAMMRIKGAATSSPIDTSSVATGTSNTPTASTITPSVNNCLIIYTMGCDDDEVTFNSGFPSGYSGVWAESNDDGADIGTIIARLEQTTATATGSVAGSFTASEEWVALAIAIKPAVAAGIAYDAGSNSGYQAAASSYNWNHTCTGADRYLTVGIAMLSLAQSVSSITYNGVALSLLGVQASITGAARVELWGLVAPSTGTNSIAVTLTGAIASAGVASSYTGVHQTSPTEAFNSAQATNVGAADATVAVTTVADNDWCVDIVATDDAAITVGAGQTQTGNVTGAGGSGAMSYEGPKAPAGSVTMSWANVAALATWSIGSVALRPIAAVNIGFIPRIIFF